MQEILSKIQLAFKSAFGTDSALVHIDAVPEQIPGWDSLGHVKLTSQLEKTFNISFDIDELMAMENVKAIIEVISKRIN